MTTFDIDAHAAAVTSLVRKASRRSLAWYRTAMTVDNKLAEGYDPVTEADRAVEDEIREGLERLFPDHAILGEERGLTGSGPYRWTIDPIDGTRAFVTGQPMWGTLVGLQAHGVPIAGWMHQPVLDETHVATPAGGRLLFGDPGPEGSGPRGASVPLRARDTTELGTAIMLCTHPEMFAPGPEAEAFARLDAAVRMTRYSGDCANYGLLAAGHVDLVVENGLAPYDIVPLIPIVEAAGAVITDLAGELPVDGGYVVAAATPELHAATLAVLA
ncbi:MAG: hypothetical protein OEV40_01045 [Acidimicrobiia bacterium]|nr:hypothetical protein [Acidimicrobiia bacterium]